VAADDVQVFPAGNVRFSVEHRSFGSDRGPAVRVFGEVDGKERQLLRFDCFENDPHYHYDPDGRNEQLHLSPELDTVSWAADHIERNLAVMIRLAGYPELAAGLESDEVAAALPQVRAALQSRP
jgi:hypothetical protein